MFLSLSILIINNFRVENENRSKFTDSKIESYAFKAFNPLLKSVFLRRLHTIVFALERNFLFKRVGRFLNGCLSRTFLKATPRFF